MAAEAAAGQGGHVGVAPLGARSVPLPLKWLEKVEIRRWGSALGRSTRPTVA